jgi:hypothetical protein
LSFNVSGSGPRFLGFAGFFMAAFISENLRTNCVRVKQAFALSLFDGGYKAFAIIQAARVPAK